MKNEKWDIIAKHLAGETTAEEERQLQEWKQEDDEFLHETEELNEIWNAADKSFDQRFDAEKGWDKFLENAGQTGKVRSISGQSNIFSLNWMKVAAAVAVLAVAVFVAYFYMESSAGLTASTGAGETQEILLADGSKVWLNENSTFTYPDEFDGEERNVTLSGEAYFEVAEDASKPFIITGENSSTKVLGTSFNLSAYPDQAAELVLLTGKVQFTNLTSGSEAILTPGMAAIAVGGELVTIDESRPNALAWKTGKLTFTNNTLDNVIADIEAYFKVNIEASESLKNCNFTGEFDHPEKEEVLDALAYALDLEYAVKGNKILLKGGNCQ